jgi:NAD(P)-dependent dehydrogenase (short-subunit alcohol dehydrogenase family)
MKTAVVVTGSAGDIGVAICRRLCHEGFYVIGLDKNSSSDVDLAFQVDIGDSEELIAIGQRISGEFAIKSVIHNAAVQYVKKAGETSLPQWTEILQVNVVAIDALLSTMLENLSLNRGSVVIIGSVHARATTGGLTAYATTKAALEGWARSAALDLGPNIRVNVVAPGAIDSAKLREGFARWGDESSEARIEVLKSRTALGRLGTPADVAGAVSFLVGDNSLFVTGTTLIVDGGATARLGSE